MNVETAEERSTVEAATQADDRAKELTVAA